MGAGIVCWESVCGGEDRNLAASEYQELLTE